MGSNGKEEKIIHIYIERETCGNTHTHILVYIHNVYWISKKMNFICIYINFNCPYLFGDCPTCLEEGLEVACRSWDRGGKGLVIWSGNRVMLQRSDLRSPVLYLWFWLSGNLCAASVKLWGRCVCLSLCVCVCVCLCLEVEKEDWRDQS